VVRDDGRVLVTSGEDDRSGGPGNQQRDQNRGGYHQRPVAALRFLSVTTRGRHCCGGHRRVVDSKITDHDIEMPGKSIGEVHARVVAVVG
jgi:hypothetical protein